MRPAKPKSSNNLTSEYHGDDAGELSQEEILRKLASSKRPKVPFRLGQACTFRGQKYRITGHVRWDTRDGYRTYRTNEFLLHNTEDGSQRWLSQYYGHYTLLEKCDPPVNASAEPRRWSVGQNITLDGEKWQVGERPSESTISWVEGEIPWVAEVGDSITGVDAARPPFQIAVEWTEDEMEWFRGEYLQRQEVAKAFGMPLSKLPRPKGVVWQQPFHEPAWRTDLFRASLVAAALLLVVCVWAFTQGTKAGGFTLNARDYDGMWVSQPFEITKTGLSEMTFRTRLSDEWCYMEGGFGAAGRWRRICNPRTLSADVVL